MTRCSMDIHRPAEAGALIFDFVDTGKIVSALEKAVNIRVSNRLLVSVVRHPAAMTPMSIHCPELLDRTDIRSSIGRTVAFEGGVLTTDRWVLDANGAKRFEGLPAAGRQPVMGIIGMCRFERILHFCGQSGGLLGVTGFGPPHNPFASRGRQIVEMLLASDRKHLAAHLSAFVGLGPGFTPSGDDLICGFLLGAALSGCDDQRSPHTSSSSQDFTLDQTDMTVFRQASEGTSDAGKTLIWMALQGRFPRFLCRAGAELSRAETANEILAAVKEATRYGHTSGTDALTGLLLYLKIRH